MTLGRGNNLDDDYDDDDDDRGDADDADYYDISFIVVLDLVGIIVGVGCLFLCLLCCVVGWDSKDPRKGILKGCLKSGFGF